jgi:hypothetical protein
MPRKTEYQDLSLGAAIRHLAEHHYEQRIRHLSHDEYRLLLRAAEAIERARPAMAAFV